MSDDQPPESLEPPSAEDPWAFLDKMQFDEEFIRGGRHEPPARTRESIARYGGQRTSWRHGSPSPAGAGAGRGPGAKRAHRGRWAGIVIVGLAVLGVAAYFGVLRPSGTRANVQAGLPAPASAQGTISASPNAPSSSPNVHGASASPTDSSTPVHGVSPADPVGTCYASPDPNSTTSVDVSKIDCAKPHSFELATHEVASGAVGTYPSPDYWNGPVTQTCLRDLIAYTGKDPSRFPTGLSLDQFIPTAQSWATGDRSVYCLAETVPASSTSARAAAH